MYSGTIRYDKDRKQFHVVIKTGSHQVWAGWVRTDVEALAQVREWKISAEHVTIL